MKISQRTKVITAIILWLPILCLFGYFLVYETLKFGFIIHRVESAQTSSEEREAFALAKRWGCCWEIHLESPPKAWLDHRQLDAVVGDPGRSLVVELEWLESKPSGVPYRARRTLMEKSNVYVLLSDD